LSGTKSNGTDNKALAGRKGLEPIEAFSTPGDVIYADIVPAKQKPVDKNSTDDQKEVIYSDLSAVPAPVVKADDTA